MSQPIAQGKVTRGVIILAGLVVVIAGMRAAATLIVPLLLAAAIAVVCAPPLLWMQRKRMPDAVAVTLMILLVVALNVGLTAFIGTSIKDFSNNLPTYQTRLSEQFGAVFTLLGDYGIHLPKGTILQQVNPGSAMTLAGNLLSGLGNVLTNALFIIITAVFILLEVASFPRKLKNAFGEEEHTSDFFRKFTRGLNDYLKIKTAASLATGILAGLLCWLLGVDYPVLWGLLAFAFNYVPSIGAILAALPPTLLAFIQFGLFKTVVVAVGYLVLNTVFGTFIEPKYMGKGLGLSTLVVFLSLVVWGWVLGPVGMLLSVPLTMMAKIALEANDETRWIAVLLGAE